MPASSDRKKCRQFWVGKYAGNVKSKKMLAMLNRNKIQAEKNACKFEPKKMLVILGRKKLLENRQWPANLQVC